MQDSKDIQDNGDMQGSKTVRWLEYKRRQMQRKILRKCRILISTLAPGFAIVSQNGVENREPPSQLTFYTSNCHVCIWPHLSCPTGNRFEYRDHVCSLHSVCL
jgi:hypothetical protein